MLFIFGTWVKVRLTFVIKAKPFFFSTTKEKACSGSILNFLSKLLNLKH